MCLAHNCSPLFALIRLIRNIHAPSVGTSISCPSLTWKKNRKNTTVSFSIIQSNFVSTGGSLLLAAHSMHPKLQHICNIDGFVAAPSWTASLWMMVTHALQVSPSVPLLKCFTMQITRICFDAPVHSAVALVSLFLVPINALRYSCRRKTKSCGHISYPTVGVEMNLCRACSLSLGIWRHLL